MPSALQSSRNAWIPWLYVLVFIPVIAVNVMLVRLALSSNTGLVTDRAFDTGQSYNAVIAAGGRQQALGWKAAIDIQPAARADAPHRLTISVAMTEESGKPLTGLSISGHVISPVDPQPDLEIALDENAGGIYRGAVSAPRQGQWEAQLVATRGDERFAIQQRLIAP